MYDMMNGTICFSTTTVLYRNAKGTFLHELCMISTKYLQHCRYCSLLTPENPLLLFLRAVAVLVEPALLSTIANHASIRFLTIKYPSITPLLS